MKKYFLLLLLQFVASYSFAQWSVGVVGGYNYTGITYPASTISSAYYTSSTSLKSGFNAGVVFENSFGNFSFQPGIIYTSVGGKFQSSYLISSPSSNVYQTQTSDVTLNYIQIPLNFVYNFRFKAGKIFLGAGPYFALNTSGTNKYVNTTTGTQPINGTDDITTKYEIGVNGLAGVELKSGVFLKLNYQYGSNSITTYSDEDIKNYGGSISIGYFFFKGKPKPKE